MSTIKCYLIPALYTIPEGDAIVKFTFKDDGITYISTIGIYKDKTYVQLLSNGLYIVEGPGKLKFNPGMLEEDKLEIEFKDKSTKQRANKGDIKVLSLSINPTLDSIEIIKITNTSTKKAKPTAIKAIENPGNIIR